MSRNHATDRNLQRDGRRFPPYDDNYGNSGESPHTAPIAYSGSPSGRWLNDHSRQGRRHERYDLWDRDPKYYYGGQRRTSRSRNSQRTVTDQLPNVGRPRHHRQVSPLNHSSREHDVELRSADNPQLNPDNDESEEGSVYSAIKKFATDTTTAHGFPNIFKSKSIVGQLLWAVIFFVAFGVFVWQTSVLVKRFLSYPVAVEVKIITRSELEFPAVTICNTNKVRRSALRQSKYKEALIIDDGQTLPYYGPCIEGDFVCRLNNLCIKQFLRCDGINHCRDFSDEYDCTYEPCSANEFQCTNGSAYGVCISMSLQCNRDPDCYDAEDETGCPCKPSEFQCTRGGCIPKYLLCNNKGDCLDNSDEDNCSPDTNCTGPFFRCTSSNECILKAFVCDKDNDCPEGEDETQEACDSVAQPTTPAPRCAKTEFDCGDGTCIWSSWVCDGSVECVLTGADEDPKMCNRDEQTYGSTRCSSEEWLCANGWQCIYEGSRCDLHRDCYSPQQDWDDEVNCTCILRATEPSSSQKIECLGVTGRNRTLGFPTVAPYRDKEFVAMECYNSQAANPTPNLVWDWDDYVCQGTMLCWNAVNDFPEPCEVLHECYIAPNGQDYRGSVSYTTSFTRCLDWNDSLAEEAGFSRQTYPELVGPVCRNPGGNRSAAWCFVQKAATVDDWEFCGIGKPSSTCHPGVDLPLRLAGRASTSMGRVEVLHNGEWGTISDTDWTMEDAAVVCRQLGFAGSSGKSTFAASTGSIFLSQVKCTGHETKLVDCRYHVVMPTEELSHNLDVSVTCFGGRRKRQPSDDQVPMTKASCPDGYFACGSGDCVPVWQTCNNFPDCQDGSDEFLNVDCDHPDIQCVEGATPCRGSPRCISQQLECDGFSDCPRGTDEQFCNDPQDSCPVDYFKCNNGKCIHHFKVCNTIADCLQAEDEGPHCIYSTDEDGFLKPFMNDSWRDPFHPFLSTASSEILLDTFRDNYYFSRPFSRVLTEDPADWQRFITYSEQPDYSDLSEVLKLTANETHLYGHQYEDFILQCSYDGLKCDKMHFREIQNDKYGNCFMFNFKDPEGRVNVLNSSRTGEQAGLALTLNIEQDEYLSLYGREVGARVVITRPDVNPLPTEEGINVQPGLVTSIGLRYNVITRKPDPFGDCQINKTEVAEIVNGKIVNVKTDIYNRMHCLRVCVLQKILETCHCSDSIDLDGERCKLLNATQDLCRQMMYFLHTYELLNCSCMSQCDDHLYTSSVSQAVWPSDAFRPHLLRNIHYVHPKTKRLRSAEDIRKNLIRLKIFFKELNYQETREVADYTGTSLFGDVGGTIGLYIGFSIITFLEFIQLLIHLIWSRCTSRTKGHIRR